MTKTFRVPRPCHSLRVVLLTGLAALGGGCATHSIEGDFPRFNTVSIVTDKDLEQQMRKGGNSTASSVAGGAAGGAAAGATAGAMAGLACGFLAPACMAAGAVFGAGIGAAGGGVMTSSLDLHDFMRSEEANRAHQLLNQARYQHDLSDRVASTLGTRVPSARQAPPESSDVQLVVVVTAVEFLDRDNRQVAFRMSATLLAGWREPDGSLESDSKEYSYTTPPADFDHFWGNQQTGFQAALDKAVSQVALAMLIDLRRGDRGQDSS